MNSAFLIFSGEGFCQFVIPYGIPGLVLFILGYRLSGGVVDTFTELTTESLGVTFATIAMTLFGLFAMMVALMLYIMGKQVEQIQAQYEWPNKE